MQSTDEILNELREISPLIAGMEKKNVFSVPEKYFSAFAHQVLEKINIDAGLFSLPKINFLNVPEGYFENLSSHILQKIKQVENETATEELKQISPMLYSVQNKNVFKVPAAYFANLSEQILRKIKPGAKVVTMSSPVWRIAVAALVTGIIAVSSLLVFEKSAQQPKGITASAVAPIPAYTEVTAQYKNEQQINEGILKLSDDEVIKYLETTGNATDNDALTTNVHEKELPAQQDYLLEEKTLDTYLNQIQLKSSAN